MAVGEIITAARYNLMQAKVNSVLGNGTDDYGYGQSLSSSQVQKVTNVVRASHMQKLKTDINNATVHQTNIATTIPNVANDDDITDAVYAQYEAASNTIFANHLAFDVNQVTAPESKISSRRTQVWGGGGDPQTVRHEFKVTFNSADHIRHFFNSGGEIRVRGTLTGGTGAKYTEWVSMLGALGVVTMNYNTTTAGSGTSFAKGAYDLTTSYQTLWTKAGSGVYSENLITVKAKKSSNVITMMFEFYDGESLITLQGFDGIDERVNGTLTSIVEQQRATGNFVEVPTPVYSTTVELG
mgnify:FL=1